MADWNFFFMLFFKDFFSKYSVHSGQLKKNERQNKKKSRLTTSHFLASSMDKKLFYAEGWPEEVLYFSRLAKRYCPALSK